MPTATKTRRKATRTKRGRPAADDFPCPFSELPLRLRKDAIESYRRSGRSYDATFTQFTQEDLGEVLKYEFGLKPEYKSYRGKDGRAYKGPPCIYWDDPSNVEFAVDDFDIDEILKHGGDKEALDKEHGPHYFKPEAKSLAVLLAEVVLLEAGLGMDFEASYSLKAGKYSDHDRVEWRWDRGDGPTYYPTTIPGSDEYQEAERLFNRIDEALKNYYDAACSRLCECIEADHDWHGSDEYLEDLLEGNDHILFDAEGQLQ